MSQVLQKCEACGKVETPLEGGRCPACVRSGRYASVAEPGTRSLDREAASLVRRSRVLPSTFIWAGLVLQGLGAAAYVLGQAAHNSRAPYREQLAVAAVLFAVAALAFGSILVPVGVIRWAIWPLIEKADERD